MFCFRPKVFHNNSIEKFTEIRRVTLVVFYFEMVQWSAVFFAELSLLFEESSSFHQSFGAATRIVVVKVKQSLPRVSEVLQ